MVGSAVPDPDEIRYYVEDDQGNKKGFATIDQIAKEYGIGPARVRKGLEHGEWMEVVAKKNLS